MSPCLRKWKCFIHRGYKNWVESSKETGMFQGRKDFLEKGNGLFKMKEKTWQTWGTWEALCALTSVSIFSLISDEIAKAQVHYRMSDWARNINTFKPLTGVGYQSFLSVQLLSEMLCGDNVKNENYNGVTEWGNCSFLARSNIQWTGLEQQPPYKFWCWNSHYECQNTCCTKASLTETSNKWLVPELKLGYFW